MGLRETSRARLQIYKIQVTLKVQESWFLVFQSFTCEAKTFKYKTKKRKMYFLHSITPALNLNQYHLERMWKCSLPGLTQTLIGSILSSRVILMLMLEPAQSFVPRPHLWERRAWKTVSLTCEGQDELPGCCRLLFPAQQGLTGWSSPVELVDSSPQGLLRARGSWVHPQIGRQAARFRPAYVESSEVPDGHWRAVLLFNASWIQL